MPGGTLILTTSRNNEDIPSIEMIESNKNSVVDQTGELESKVVSNTIESKLEELLVNKNILGLSIDPTCIDNDLDMTENVELKESMKA